MKNKIPYLIGVALAAMALTGCGSQPGDQSPAPANPPSAPSNTNSTSSTNLSQAGVPGVSGSSNAGNPASTNQ